MKSFTLDGKRHKVHPKIPVVQIRMLVSRQHVGEPDDKIMGLITERATANDWPRAATDSASKLAVWFHRKNQALVRDLRL